MVNVVFALSQLEINDVYRIHLAHFVVVVAFVYVFGYRLRHAVEHTVEIRYLVTVLYFDDYQFAVLVLGKHIHAVILVEKILLIAFALEEMLDFHLLADKGVKQSLQHGMVCLVAQQAFHRPVKPYVFVVISFHGVLLILVGFNIIPIPYIHNV